MSAREHCPRLSRSSDPAVGRRQAGNRPTAAHFQHGRARIEDSSPPLIPVEGGWQ